MPKPPAPTYEGIEERDSIPERLALIDMEFGELRATMPPKAQARIKRIVKEFEAIVYDFDRRLCALEPPRDA